MPYCRRIGSIALVLFAAPASVARAQAAASDSILWQRVVDYVAKVERPRGPNAAVDTVRRALNLHIYADEPLRGRLESQVSAMLHGRPATPGDTMTYTLELGPVRMANDTAYVHMFTRASYPCPGNAQRWQGGESTQDVRIVRLRDGSWGPAPERHMGAISDYGC